MFACLLPYWVRAADRFPCIWGRPHRHFDREDDGEDEGEDGVTAEPTPRTAVRQPNKTPQAKLRDDAQSPAAEASRYIERVPFGMGVFDSSFIVFGRFLPKIEAFGGAFSVPQETSGL